MSLLPHAGDWRTRYREGLGFNYHLLVFAGSQTGMAAGKPTASTSFFSLAPANLILRA